MDVQGWDFGHFMVLAIIWSFNVHLYHISSYLCATIERKHKILCIIIMYPTKMMELSRLNNSVNIFCNYKVCNGKWLLWLTGLHGVAKRSSISSCVLDDWFTHLFLSLKECISINHAITHYFTECEIIIKCSFIRFCSIYNKQ